MNPSSRARILVAGGGLTGLLTAFWLVRAGAQVQVVDPNVPGRGASWAAAGLLSRAYEWVIADHIDPLLFRLGGDALVAWDELAAILAGEYAIELEIDKRGTLAVAPAGSEPGLAGMNRRLDGLGAASTPGERRGRPAIEMDDWQVDNRQAIDALIRCLAEGGVEFECARFSDGQVAGVDVVVDARGWQGRHCVPVRGAALAFRPSAALPDRPLRFGHHYFAPKADRVILGATSEPGSARLEVTRLDVDALMRAGGALVDGLQELDIMASWAGVRPQTPDGRPVFGWRSDRVVSVGGVYRNGVLLAPYLARLAAASVLGHAVPERLTPLSPQRFAPAG